MKGTENDKLLDIAKDKIKETDNDDNKPRSVVGSVHNEENCEKKSEDHKESKGNDKKKQNISEENEKLNLDAANSSNHLGKKGKRKLKLSPDEGQIQNLIGAWTEEENENFERGTIIYKISY